MDVQNGAKQRRDRSCQCSPFVTIQMETSLPAQGAPAVTIDLLWHVLQYTLLSPAFAVGLAGLSYASVRNILVTPSNLLVLRLY